MNELLVQLQMRWRHSKRMQPFKQKKETRLPALLCITRNGTAAVSSSESCRWQLRREERSRYILVFKMSIYRERSW